MESYVEYRVICTCHGPLHSGITEKAEADAFVANVVPDNAKHRVYIEQRRITKTDWQEVAE